MPFYKDDTDKQAFQKNYLKLKQKARAYYKYMKLTQLKSLEVHDTGRLESLRQAGHILGLKEWEK